MKFSANSRGITAATLAALCWGSATVMSKSALDAVSPVMLLLLQLIASAVVLWTGILLTARALPRLRALKTIAALGLLEPGLAYLLGLVGLTAIGAGAATLIQASEAIMIVGLSALLLGIRASFRMVVLSAIALAGLVPALGLLEQAAVQNQPFGIAMMFLATASAAVYVTLSSRIASDHAPIVIVGIQQLAALGLALVMLPAEMFLTAGGVSLPRDMATWALVAVSGIVQYAVAFSLYMYALANISANRAGSFLNLTPVFGLILAFLALGETLSLIQLAGAAVTIVAVSLIHMRSESGSTPAQPATAAEGDTRH